jgi:hypothetical protein
MAALAQQYRIRAWESSYRCFIPSMAAWRLIGRHVVLMHPASEQQHGSVCCLTLELSNDVTYTTQDLAVMYIRHSNRSGHNADLTFILIAWPPRPLQAMQPLTGVFYKLQHLSICIWERELLKPHQHNPRDAGSTQPATQQHKKDPYNDPPCICTTTKAPTL